MILDKGYKILVLQRRLFEEDHARFFVGIVDGYENGVVRATGTSWIRNTYSGKFERKQDLRTKILSIGSGTLVVYQLPSGCDLNALEFQVDASQNLILTDGASLRMDLSEGWHPPPRATRKAS